MKQATIKLIAKAIARAEPMACPDGPCPVTKRCRDCWADALTKSEQTEDTNKKGTQND